MVMKNVVVQAEQSNFIRLLKTGMCLAVVVCDSNQTDVISDAGIHRMRSCYKRSLHNMNDSDILVIVFGDKKSTAFTEDNIMIVDEFCRRIEKVRVDQKFSPLLHLQEKALRMPKTKTSNFFATQCDQAFIKNITVIWYIF